MSEDIKYPLINGVLEDTCDVRVTTGDDGAGSAEDVVLTALRYNPNINAFELEACRQPEQRSLKERIGHGPIVVYSRGRKLYQIEFETMSHIPATFDMSSRRAAPEIVHELVVLRGIHVEVF